MISVVRAFSLALALLAVWPMAARTQVPPYSIAPNLFDAAKPDLGLKPVPGAQTVTIFKPDATSDHYSNGVVLLPFKGRLYAQWQGSRTDEDAPDTSVVFSSSADGVTWGSPQSLMPAGTNGQQVSSGGWWSDGTTLIAYINVWPMGFASGEGGYVEYLTSLDGVHWSVPQRVMGADGQPVDGVIEQDPHALPSGRVITAFHLRPGTIATPYYTGDPLAISGWTRGDMAHLPYGGKGSRELEPSLFRQGACLVMVFRDQGDSFRQLAARSCDDGVHWMPPVVTNMPDSRAKQSAGNLPDGTAFMINEPSGNKTRLPLTITLSRDGQTFDRAFLLRGTSDIQPLRFTGLYKRPGYHYPKSVVWNGALYVGYATNKEDVEVTRLPISGLTGH